MAHANARLTVHGRLLLVTRVLGDGRPVAHVAKELGVSRQCAHRWVARFRAEGAAGLQDRSSRPHRCPRRTPAEVEQRVLALRRLERRGQDWLGPELDMPARTVGAVLRRHQVPRLAVRASGCHRGRLSAGGQGSPAAGSGSVRADRGRRTGLPVAGGSDGRLLTAERSPLTLGSGHGPRADPKRRAHGVVHHPAFVNQLVDKSRFLGLRSSATEWLTSG